jgi:hypothetical protein
MSKSDAKRDQAFGLDTGRRMGTGGGGPDDALSLPLTLPLTLTMILTRREANRRGRRLQGVRRRRGRPAEAARY